MISGFAISRLLPGLGRLARAMALLVPIAMPAAALAHSGGASGGTGLPIAAISHGEMMLVDERLPEIVALAKAQMASDGPVRRLLNYYNVQRAYCLWGLAPGGVSREDSPFNLCAHAYLAAAKEMLLAMSREPASRAAALGIIARLEDRRQALPDAWAICSSSNEGFDTSSVIRPVFAEVAADPAIRAAGAGGACAFAGMAFTLVALRRARDRTPGSQP